MHGGGSNRRLWIPQVRYLGKKFRCVSVDLPGHASRLKEKLTLDSAINAVIQVLDDLKITRKVLYCGNSFGGYLGFYVVGRYPERFCGAMICGASQNVGVGASFQAQIGLSFLEWTTSFSKKRLMSLMVSTSGNLISKELIDECMLRTGLYFEQAHEQVIKPADYALNNNF